MSRLSDEMIEELDALMDDLTPGERGDFESFLDMDHPGGTPDTNSQIKYLKSIKGRRMMDGGEVVPKKYKGFPSSLRRCRPRSILRLRRSTRTAAQSWLVVAANSKE